MKHLDKLIQQLIKDRDALLKMEDNAVEFAEQYPVEKLVEYKLNLFDTTEQNEVREAIFSNKLLETRYENVCKLIDGKKINSLTQFQHYTKKKSLNL